MTTTHRMVGDSTAMAALRARLIRYGASTAPVLVQGETGAGKELAARGLHAASGRRGAFVAVNCGAIPRELVEAELFGSVPGAFTGARRRLGHVAQADGGTLFLDEVGELPPPAQVVLLRVLETGHVCPVGADRGQAVDFRLISATHRRLLRLVEAGRFRADLFHRIAGLTVEVPPLRDRVDDLPALAAALVGEGARRLRPDVFERLARHPWPGNVRELRNVLLRGLADADGVVTAAHLRFDDTTATPVPHDWDGLPLRVHLAQHVRAVFRRHNHNVRATARALEVSHTTVYRYLATDEP